MTKPTGADAEHEADPAAPRLAGLAAVFGNDGPPDLDELDGPVHWPSLPATEAPSEWEALRAWVARFLVRFPTQTRIPDCWWQHNELVEALAALRDHERACFASTAPATAAVEWHRAFRDMEARWETWIRRFRCTHDPDGHNQLACDDTPPPDWEEWIAHDTRRRDHRALTRALNP